ncbi:helix-turn-helix domain-containing protein [Streptomyces sp. NPDC046984]|uniref:MarR family transcriptional regulator n=1 Tax=Streptomyces sp. NPDC046984 TaxID=3155138 RepID=UPI0033DC93AD
MASDIAAHPDSAVGEIAARTRLPQSQVSTAVAPLREAGSVRTVPDPADRCRMLVRQAVETSERVARVRATDITAALASALGTDDPARLRGVTAALGMLAAALTPTPPRPRPARPMECMRPGRRPTCGSARVRPSGPPFGNAANAVAQNTAARSRT